MLADIRSRNQHMSHVRIGRLSTFDRISQGMMNLLGFIMSLVYMQAVHRRLPTYERLVNLNIVIHLIDIREGSVIKPQSIFMSDMQIGNIKGYCNAFTFSTTVFFISLLNC